MKKVLLPVFVIVAVVMIIVGCKKNSDSSSTPVTPAPDNTVTKEYFEVTDALYVPQAFPEANSDVEIEVNMNNNVITGGTNYITVESPVKAEKIYIGLDGEDGYYVFVPDENGSKDDVFTYDLIMIIDQQLTAEEFTVVVAILDEEGNISTTYNTSIALITAGTGGLQVSLSFNNSKDVDLHLFEPNGTHVYYGHRNSENGGFLDIDSNPSCRIDGVNNENIFYNDSTAYIEPGRYTVYVDMYENCDYSVATSFVLTVFYNGQMIQTSAGSNPIAATFPEGTPSNYNNLSNIEPVCTFDIPDNGQTPPAKSYKRNLPAFLRSVDK